MLISVGVSVRKPVNPGVDHCFDLHLLTAKPFIYVFNVDEGALGDAGVASDLAERVRPAQAVVLCAQIEAEVAGLDPADAKELLRSYGQEESGLEQLVHVGFSTLELQTFLTEKGVPVAEVSQSA